MIFQLQAASLTISQQDAAERCQADEYGADAIEAKGEPAGGHQVQKPCLCKGDTTISVKSLAQCYLNWSVAEWCWSRHLSEGPDVRQTSSSVSPRLWRLGLSTGPEETRTDGRRRDSGLQGTAKGIKQFYTTSAHIKTSINVMFARQGMCLAYLWTRDVWCLAMYRGRSVSGTRRRAAAGRRGWGWEGWRKLPRRPLPHSVKTTGENNSRNIRYN